MNLFTWSGIGSLIGGTLLLAIWAVLNFVDDVAQYMPYADPLISPVTLGLMLVVGLLNIGNFVVAMIATGMVASNKASVAKILALISSILQVAIPPVGTYFAVTLLSLLRAWPEHFAGDGPAMEEREAITLVLYYGAFMALAWGFLLLVLPAVYFLPVEFLNNAEYIELRFQIWNIIYWIVAAFGIFAGFSIATGILAYKNVLAWKGCLWVVSIVSLFAIPIGPYLSGVFYRNLLKRR